MNRVFNKHLNPENLYHTNLLEGETSFLLKELLSFLENSLKFKVTNNPDLLAFELETFGIEESRTIKSIQSRRPVASDKKVVIIVAHFFTLEAQNSLLKVFEEPTGETLFFIITPTTEGIIPTILSRVQVTKIKGDEKRRLEEESLSASEFLKAKPARRIEMLKDIVENKEKLRAIELLDSLEGVLRKNFLDKGLNKEEVSALEEVIKSRDFLRDRSPSVKMIMEHLSVVLPVTKGVF